MNILNKLTIKHLTMNKKRTIVTIIGIILSTALMVGIGTLASSFRENALRETIKMNGDHHVIIKDVRAKDLKYLENNREIRRLALNQKNGYAVLDGSKNDYKPYLYFEAANETALNQIKVIEGRLPKNEKEIIISSHIRSNGEVNLKVGDTITVAIGDRKIIDPNSPNFDFSDELDQTFSYEENEQLVVKETKTFTIVGIMPRQNTEPYQAPGYTVYTKLEQNQINDASVVDATITYQKTKNVHKKTNRILRNLENKGLTEQYDVMYNEGVLSFYGESTFESINETLTSVIIIVLFFIMIGCAIVIYNSFAISVMERKKQFGLFSSIGATKKQLRKTVFYEAFLVSLIGIPIGILSGIFGIYVVLQITNQLLPDVFGTSLALTLYPWFIILPVGYMIITILISAYLPARKASKISPIEAIRLNDDIKINRHSVQSNPIIGKVFGIEGELARKNMKRNKKKYRITILSLIVSIFLFITFSTFVEYASKSTGGILNVKNYDITAYYSVESETSEVNQEVMKQLWSVPGIDHIEKIRYYYSHLIRNDFITNSFIEVQGLGDWGILTLALPQTEYEEYLKKLGLPIKAYEGDELRPLVWNRYSNYNEKKKKIDTVPIFKKQNNVALTLREVYAKEQDKDYEDIESIPTTTMPVTLVDQLPSKQQESFFDHSITMVISEEMEKALFEKYEGYFSSVQGVALVNAKEHKKVTTEMTKIIEAAFGENGAEIHITDITEEMEFQKNLVIVVGMFLYGFIALVTLIGVTSVFNTIHTSMALRRKEFAVLRSIGLTPKGFNKMLCYESFLYGLKALLIGIPLSFGGIGLFHLAFQHIVSYQSLLIPWNAILIASIAVFFITFLSMMYATKKTKKENILDAIREENI